jgi:hypothetical protein
VVDIIEEDTEVVVVEIDNSTKEDNNLRWCNNNNSIKDQSDSKFLNNQFLKDLS